MLTVPVSDLTYLSAENLFKIVISSADKFPGLYRMSSSWAEVMHDPKFLKWLHFIDIIQQAQKGKKWTKKQWFAVHDELFLQAYGKESRNDQRAEDDLKILLKDRARNWYQKPSSFRLAVIDSQNPVEKIEKNTTYYMMGSLIRFEETCVKISYDHYSQKCYQKLDVSWNFASDYISQTFSSKSLSELFFKAEVIAHLNFSEDGVGDLMFNLDQIYENFGTFFPQSHVFASIIYKNDLPIQFAKPIGVQNVGLIS
jgi:hypothetical protein